MTPMRQGLLAASWILNGAGLGIIAGRALYQQNEVLPAQPAFFIGSLLLAVGSVLRYYCQRRKKV
jgi:hypothetical protein